jgi:type II secretory pathway pseudopilin PulG
MELLVVVAIIAVLVGAALPYVQNYVGDSKISKARADLDEIAKSIAAYEMREGPYNATDAGLLTGRYLTRTPLDPWGQRYVISTLTAEVYSAGPDRDLTTRQDNLINSYQPPLALMSATWLDRNGTGAPDGDSPNDQVVLQFSRVMANTTASFTAAGTLNATFHVSSGTMDEHFIVASTTVASSQRELYLSVKGKQLFIPREHTVEVIPNQTLLVDYGGKYALGSQAVRIMSR